MEIDVNKVFPSDQIPCSNGKDWRYIVGWQTERKTIIIPLLIKTHKDLLSSQYNKGSHYTMNFNVGADDNVEWLYHYRNLWNEVE